VSRVGEGPVVRLKTIPSKRKKIVGGGVGMKGIISAMALCKKSGVLAAGTFSRGVGLYDSEGSGDCIAVFSVADEPKHGNELNSEVAIAGRGITQVLWSPCGRYLYVVERCSCGVQIYDIRVAGKRVGCLVGRDAETNQRLGVDVVNIREDRHEIWAGGLDGVVRVWENPGDIDGNVEPFLEWKAHTGMNCSFPCQA
jgi:hypothetical protein